MNDRPIPKKVIKGTADRPLIYVICNNGVVVDVAFDEDVAKKMRGWWYDYFRSHGHATTYLTITPVRSTDPTGIQDVARKSTL